MKQESINKLYERNNMLLKSFSKNLLVKHLTASALIVSLFLSNMSHAENLNEDVETIVVIGSLSSAPAEEITSNVSVLTTNDIKRLNKSNVMDLLRTIPGIGISQQGGAGGPSDLSIRGGESNYTLVLIDGVQVNDPTNTRGGSYNFNQLSVEEIERVEVIRGPQSALYGSDALSGVINIITHKSQEGTKHFVSLSAGQEEYGSGVYSFNQRSDSIDTSIKLSTQTTGEQIEGSESEQDAFNANLKFYFDNRVSVSTQLRGTQIMNTSFPEQSGGPLFAVLRDVDQTEAEERGAKIIISRQMNEDVLVDLSSDYFNKEGETTSPGVSDFFVTNRFPFQEALEYTKNTHKLLAHFENINNVKISIGAELKQEQGGNTTDYDFANLGFNSGATNVSRFELERDNYALLSEGTYIHENKNNTKWIASVGLRRDEFENNKTSFSDIPLPPTFAAAGTNKSKSDGSENSFHLGAKYFVNDFVLFSNYGEAFKLPSFYALGEGNVGNPNLENEFSESYDVGFEWRITDSQQVIWSYFNNRFENLITFSGVIVNVPDTVKIEGSEFIYDWTLNDALKFSFNTTYSHIQDLSKPGAITFDARPQWLANLITQWEFKPQWQSSLALRWSDKSLSTSVLSPQAQILDAYTLADLSVAYDSNNYGLYQINIDNLADEDYQEAVGFPGVGRSLRAKWSYSF